MTIFELEQARKRAPIALSDLDFALTVQLVVAWAGENGEERRLGWWRSDLVSRFGGQDLFRRLLPATWPWAVLQGAREAARRRDTDLRRQDHDPDAILSLFTLGFDLDERLDVRFQDLKRSGDAPEIALPGLSAGIDATWDRERFLHWIQDHERVETKTTPIGRQIVCELPTRLDRVMGKLVSGLAPLGDGYPLPHFRRLK